MKSVLVVEESPDLRRLLIETLPTLFPDWRMLGAANLTEAAQVHREQLLALIILDMDLGLAPNAAIALLNEWRHNGSAVPVVASTRHHAHLATVWAARPDDVLVKPWDIHEIRNRLARAVTQPTAHRSLPAPRVDGIAIVDPFVFAGASVTGDLLCRMPDGHVHRLGTKEYGILCEFMRARGKVVLREDLLRTIWGSNANSDSNSVNVYVSRLRRLFAAHGGTFDAEVATEAKIGWRITVS